ncbi:MAG: inorganic pyrophosphatase [Chlamydiales bacterium]|nr:inorganic pyrophosphatase [Chlamydiales bacterium]
MNSLYKAHPWHGIDIGEEAPKVVSCYIEIVPSDTVKYELDKVSGLLKVDRPQKYSNYCPALYGLIPQTFCGKLSGEYCAKKAGITTIVGDDDPLDVCVLSEKPILRGDILLQAIPIGGFRTIDKGDADDKIIAVLKGDLVYGNIQDISECPTHLIDRLHHYFLTYKEHPGSTAPSTLEVIKIYGKEEAHEVIELARRDYQNSFPQIYKNFKTMQEKS